MLEAGADEPTRNEVDLKQLMTETLGLPANILPFETLALTRFEIWGDISGGSYGIEIGTTSTWSLSKLGEKDVTIKDLFLRVEYDGSLTPALGGSLNSSG